MFKLPNKVVQNWAQVQANFLALERWLGSKDLILSSLPASPSNGEIAFYRPTPGVIWQCVYDAAQHSDDGNGWVVVGGSPLVNQGVGDGSNGTTTWAAMMSIAIPHAGEYDIAFGAKMWSSAANQEAQLSPGGAGLAVGTYMTVYTDYGDQYGSGGSWSEGRAPLTQASLTLYLRRSDEIPGSGVAYARRSTLRVMPVRFAS